MEEFVEMHICDILLKEQIEDILKLQKWLERLDFELLTISNSGYPGYFLIVQDLIAEAKVWVFR
jgi:DNA polymerase III alpha subunit